MHKTHVERAAALGGPDWLVEHRRSAAEHADAAAMPTADDEIWRYSRIDELDLDDFDQVPDPPAGSGTTNASGTSVGAPTGGDLAPITDPGAVVEVVDGHVVSITLSDHARGLGLSVVGAGDLDADPGLLGVAISEPFDRFTAAAAALSPGPVVVRVPDGVRLDQPVLVRITSLTDAATSAARLVVEGGAGSVATVIEVHRSAEVRALATPVTELIVRAGAELSHVVVQDVGAQMWQLATLVATVGEQAHLTVSVIALGGDYARLRIDTRIAAPGARADVRSVYFGEGDQMLDLRTVQDHLAPHTRSDLLFKGAVGGRSHSVYTGNIRIAADASDVDAFQTNRNIKLSEHAWAESVPNLEIENNDVRCSHASAIGPIDADHRFYLESRGVPPAVAERLVVLGFFDEVLDELGVVEVAEAVHDHLARRLEREISS